MKASIYYQTVFARSKAAEGVNSLLLLMINYPKIILDAFLRRDMGERYFPYLSSATMFFVACSIPHFTSKIFGMLWGYTVPYCLFLIAYAIMTVMRWVEIHRAPTVYDFARFSLDTGKPWPFFFKIARPGKLAHIRTIELYYEPLFCFLIGFFLFICYQPTLGGLIIFCSVAYFLSTHISANLSNHFILDRIDEIICNQDLTTTFVQGKEVSPRGVPFHSRKPTTQELREEFVNHVLEEEDVAEAR